MTRGSELTAWARRLHVARSIHKDRWHWYYHTSDDCSYIVLGSVCFGPDGRRADARSSPGWYRRKTSSKCSHKTHVSFLVQPKFIVEICDCEPPPQ